MKPCFIFYSVLLASQRLILIYIFYLTKHFVQAKNGKNGFQQILLQHINCSLAKQKVPDGDSTDPTFKDPHFFPQMVPSSKEGYMNENTETQSAEHRSMQKPAYVAIASLTKLSSMC